VSGHTDPFGIHCNEDLQKKRLAEKNWRIHVLQWLLVGGGSDEFQHVHFCNGYQRSMHLSGKMCKHYLVDHCSHGRIHSNLLCSKLHARRICKGPSSTCLPSRDRAAPSTTPGTPRRREAPVFAAAVAPAERLGFGRCSARLPLGPFRRPRASAGQLCGGHRSGESPPKNGRCAE